MKARRIWVSRDRDLARYLWRAFSSLISRYGSLSHGPLLVCGEMGRGRCCDFVCVDRVRYRCTEGAVQMHGEFSTHVRRV